MRQRTNASFHNFEITPLFIGQYTGENLVRQDDDPKDKNKKKGDIMGYIFNDENGMPVVVGASATIESIMNGDPEKGEKPIEKEQVMSFTYEGKGKTKAGREFNRFRVLEFVDWKEATNHHKVS